MVISLGNYHLVGTTVQNPDKLPDKSSDNILTDEKHTKFNGEKAYIATTVGNDCVLGASLAADAGEKSLTESYRQFQKETQLDLQPTEHSWPKNFLARNQRQIDIFSIFIIIQHILRLVINL